MIPGISSFGRGLLKFDTNRLVPIALSQAVGLGCGVAGVKITSRLIAPADYGTYGLFLSCAPLGMWVVHAGLLKFVSRHWAGSHDQHGLMMEVLRAGKLKLPWLALTTFAACMLLMPGHWFPGWPLLLIAATLLSYGAFTEIALQAVGRHWADFTVSAAGSLTRTLLPPLLYVTTSHTLSALFAGYVLHTFTLAIVGAFFVLAKRYRVPPRAGGTTRQLESVYEGQLFVALSIASWALTAANRWIVAGFFGADIAGFFTLAASLTIIVASMPGTVFLQYAQPGLFAAPCSTLDNRRALARRIDRLALTYAMLAVAGVFGLRAFAPWLIGPIIAETYSYSLQFIIGAGCFGVAVGTAQFFHVMLLAGKRERACGPVDLSTATILILGGIATAFVGLDWFNRWLIFTPLIPFLVTRPLARSWLLKQSEN